MHPSQATATVGSPEQQWRLLPLLLLLPAAEEAALLAAYCCGGCCCCCCYCSFRDGCYSLNSFAAVVAASGAKLPTAAELLPPHHCLRTAAAATHLPAPNGHRCVRQSPISAPARLQTTELACRMTALSTALSRSHEYSWAMFHLAGLLLLLLLLQLLEAASVVSSVLRHCCITCSVGCTRLRHKAPVAPQQLV
jgi:hypothetical protein